MANSKTNKVIHHLRRAVLLRDGAGMTDGQLLECFLTQRDDAAFAALVRRHRGMVWGVCRRLLHHHHDAEDAFQATFLVLIRKATSVEPKEMLANWLYGVAHQTALKARATAARRTVRERQVVDMPEPAVEEQEVWHDLQPLLDQELSRLPGKYRAPIVLCDLEGKTRKEAARQLAWPEGTVAGRLATARKMLAKRLARRGVALSGGTLATMLSHHAASACVPPAVVSSTIQAATMTAAGQAAATGLISVKVAALTQGVVKSMFLAKLKIEMVVLLLAVMAVVGIGAGGLLHQTSAADQPQPRKAEKPPAPEEGRPKAERKPVVLREDAIVDRLAWSTDGKIVATVGITCEAPEPSGINENTFIPPVPNSTIKLWDVRTGELKQSLGEEKKTRIAALAVSPDGKTAAVAATEFLEGGTRSQLRFFDADTWQQKRTVDQDSFVTAIAFSPDGKMLAFGGDGENGAFVKLWDVEHNKLIREKDKGKIEGTQVDCLAFSPDGKMLAVGDRDTKTRLFDAGARELKQVLTGEQGLVRSVCFSPDSKTLVTGGADNTAKLWEVKTGKLLRTLDGGVVAVAFAPNGKYIVTAGAVNESGKVKNKIVVWNAESGKAEKEIAADTVATLAFSPDGRTLAIGSGALQASGKTTGEIRLVPMEME